MAKNDAKFEETKSEEMSKLEEPPMDPREKIIKDMRPEGRAPTYVDCIIPETGEEFTAEVHQSSRYPSGRVLTLKNLSYPPEFVPASLPKDPKDPKRKQWIWENNYQKLLRQFVGKPASALLVYRKDMQEKLQKALKEVG